MTRSTRSIDFCRDIGGADRKGSKLGCRLCVGLQQALQPLAQWPVIAAGAVEISAAFGFRKLQGRKEKLPLLAGSLARAMP